MGASTCPSYDDLAVSPPERFDGTPFTDRDFGSVPSLAGVADLLEEILAA